MLESADDRLWVGSADGVWQIKLETGDFRRIQRPGGADLPGAVTRLREAPDGGVWIATEEGLFLVDAGQDVARRVVEPFRVLGANEYNSNGSQRSSANVRDLMHGADGSIWLGLWGEGVLHWRPGGSTTIYLAGLDQIAGNAAFSLLEDAQGHVWVGTRYSGLFRIDPVSGETRQFQHDAQRPHESLPNNTVNCLIQDESNVIWVCSDRGLSEFLPETQSFRTIDRSFGLPADKVVGAIQDDAGFFWVLTPRGLARFDSDRGEAIAFSRADGLEASEINPMAVVQGRQGDFYLGTVEGLSIFNPGQISSNRVAPRAAITEIRLDHQLAQPGSDVLYAQRLSVPSSTKSVSFGFAALDFHAPSRNHYRYRLVGFEAEAVEAQGRRYVTYGNLRPGVYEFMVWGSNNHGVWSPEPARLTLEVEPPWWDTRPARLLTASGFLLLLFSLHQLRVRTLRFQQTRLERKVEQRTEELERANALLSYASRTDYLTGLPNRRAFSEQAQQELARARRHDKSLCLVMLDIDHFKAVNDRLGHIGGDAVLRHVAQLLRGAIRNEDLLARWGGEEFIFLFPETSVEAGQAACQKLAALIAENPCCCDGLEVAVTITAGISGNGGEIETLEDLVRCADQALYTGKRNGRDQVVVFQGAAD